MNPIAFESPHADDVALARNAAGDLKATFVYLKSVTQNTLMGLNGAVSTAEVVMEYAAWLGRWHSVAVNLTYTMHFRGAVLQNGRLATAALQVKAEIAGIEALIAKTDHWIAVPNFENTRRLITAHLGFAISSMETAIEACAVMEGHEPTKGTAA